MGSRRENKEIKRKIRRMKLLLCQVKKKKKKKKSGRIQPSPCTACSHYSTSYIERRKGATTKTVLELRSPMPPPPPQLFRLLEREWIWSLEGVRIVEVRKRNGQLPLSSKSFDFSFIFYSPPSTDTILVCFTFKQGEDNTGLKISWWLYRHSWRTWPRLYPQR